MDFDDLIGHEFLFFGVDNHMFKLEENIWLVEEDAEDGYRSSLGPVKVAKHKGLFFREPVAIVRVELQDDARDGYILQDVEYKHTWLEFGTDNSDSYYPSFYFNYTPMDEKERNRPSKCRKPTPYISVDPFDRLFDPRVS